MNNIQPESEHGSWPVRVYIVRTQPAFTICLQHDMTAAEFKTVIATKVAGYGITDFILMRHDVNTQIDPSDFLIEKCIADIRVQQLSVPVQTRTNANSVSPTRR